jgi:hypothetical protein
MNTYLVEYKGGGGTEFIQCESLRRFPLVLKVAAAGCSKVSVTTKPHGIIHSPRWEPQISLYMCVANKGKDLRA